MVSGQRLSSQPLLERASANALVAAGGLCPRCQLAVAAAVDLIRSNDRRLQAEAPRRVS